MRLARAHGRLLLPTLKGRRCAVQLWASLLDFIYHTACTDATYSAARLSFVHHPTGQTRQGLPSTRYGRTTCTRTMDSRGSQDSGPVRSRRSTKQPMQFMFIDSTDHGVNAKPDKAVRSFVMKTARRQKPWSTRQKSPKTEAELEENSQPRSQQSSTRTYDGADEHDPASPGSWQEFAPTPSARYARSRGSAVSSRNGTFSRRPSSHLHLLPPSSRVSVCDFPHCTGDSCGQPHEAPTALGRRCGFDVGFRASFDCLPVQMDEKMRDLLENCECTDTR